MHNYNWKGKKILIAEDEDLNFMLLEEILLPTGITFLRATTGKEILSLFEENRDSNLILMDIKMPEITGYQATKIIRETSQVPIIAQTAYAMSDERQKCLNAGCNAYISKPIEFDEILTLMATFLKEGK